MFLVTGATGGIGRTVVRLLREQEKQVRAFVRLTSRYSELEQRGANIFIGDLRQEKDIQKACQGVQYIISAHGSGGDALALDYRANIELIDSAKANQVQHFVFISVLGADRGYEDAPVFKAKRAVERYLESSGLNYTILRPSGLASDLLPLAERFRETGFYLLVGDPKNRTSTVSTDDLARIIVDSVTVEAARNQILSVGGPEILMREDIPKIISRIFNREPLIINPPLLAVDGLRGALGFFNPQAQKALGTFRTLLANEFFCTREEIAKLETTFNFELETLESFLRRRLAV
ncbi:SDR family NAD(P)-dependent oxidoreductase [Brasilonema octagenarum UFV-E1]|uniref:SDR family NAD(P)-dependent oxidoreductase n=1 Tax=Brasilonema sennae CENA114 TaxID=415709 RepID=A0A856M8Q3_9CYAN|nr:SDR family oxidoreductase [Brasilonema sennae]QDL07543.1 SDR family NAD(P)-dependent oxidoreductase [Brasilonema sennae CENA114]QDL13905.1 SDR family NAD(P)-dependent oxidoreductase [Brasilonema octagenarum UFV-E1]